VYRWAGVEVLESLDEVVDPKHTALLMWDFSRAVLATCFNAEIAVENAARLVQAARAHGIPTLYARQNDMGPDALGAPMARMRMKQMGLSDPERLPPLGEKGTPGWEIDERLQPAAGDVEFDKFVPNPFDGTTLPWWLQKFGVKTIIVAGAWLETAIDGIVRDAVNRGYYAVVPRDCVGSTSEELYKLTLDVLAPSYDVFDSAEIIAAWDRRDRGGDPTVVYPGQH
jgi:nicotinamidase-related amidase